MGVSPSNWSTYQLTEFLGFLTTFDEERATILAAIERIAEAVEAEVGVVLDDKRIMATIGCNPADLVSVDLLQITASGQEQVELPRIGTARACGVPLDGAARKLVIARLAEDPFTADELNLIGGMTRVVQLVLRNIRTIEGEREARARLQERQVLLEKLGRITQSMSHRAPLQVVLRAVTEGAAELVADEVAILQLRDGENPNMLLLASSRGLTADQEMLVTSIPVGTGAPGKAVQQNELVTFPTEEGLPDEVLVPAGLNSAMAVPIRKEGRPIGSLCVASYRPDRTYSAGEKEALAALSEHAGLAVQDSSAVEALREAERSKDKLLQDIVAGIKQRDELEGQLRQSQKMEAIGQLAGGIAHDFNNLLSIIINYIEFVRDDLHDEEKLLEDVAEISGAAHRASNLTRQLLTMSRREIAEPEILDVNALVYDVERLFRRVLPESIHVIIQAGDDLGKVHADPGHIEQVLMNLVLNARDAMPDGGELRVTTMNVDLASPDRVFDRELPSGSYVQVTVSDTGRGMDGATQERIFEPFFTTKPKGEGTGLGLATVYGIVNQSGGSVGVESSPGEGATFRILLPTTDEIAAGADPSSQGEQPFRGRGETILVAEDEDGVRKLVGRILTRAGYEVLVASSGEEALEMFADQGQVVDLLLTDVVMPGMTGKALDEAARHRRPDLRTIFMSGYTDQIVAQNGLFPEGQDMIAKPFTGRELLGKIETILDGPVSTPKPLGNVESRS